MPIEQLEKLIRQKKKVMLCIGLASLFMAALLMALSSCSTVTKPTPSVDVTSCLLSSEDAGLVCSDSNGHSFKLPYAQGDGYICRKIDDDEALISAIKGIDPD